MIILNYMDIRRKFSKLSHQPNQASELKGNKSSVYVRSSRLLEWNLLPPSVTPLVSLLSLYISLMSYAVSSLINAIY